MKAVTYTIRHDIETIGCTIDSLLKSIATWHSLNDENLFEVKVILNELIVNALCHGNNCEPHKSAYVTFKLVKDYLYISVKDEGNGFKENVSKSIEECIGLTNGTFCEHGRGLIIVRQLCDRVKFNKYGNRVSVIKYLN